MWKKNTQAHRVHPIAWGDFAASTCKANYLPSLSSPMQWSPVTKTGEKTQLLNSPDLEIFQKLRIPKISKEFQGIANPPCPAQEWSESLGCNDHAWTDLQSSLHTWRSHAIRID